MKTNQEAKETAKTQPQTPKAKAPRKEPRAKVEEPADRLSITVAELKESKSGLVTFLFLSGKEKEGITKELGATFKLADIQAVKIVR